MTQYGSFLSNLDTCGRSLASYTVMICENVRVSVPVFNEGAHAICQGTH